MFAGWENFYFMLGSAAAGLIGLLFVVVTLTGGLERSQAMRGAALYLTPNVFHFAMVVTTSAVAIAPRLPAWAPEIVVGLLALLGLGHCLRATIGIRHFRPGSEAPHWSDVWFYGRAPAAIYFGLAAAAVGVSARMALAPYALAGLLLALLLLSIRNAWDLVTSLAHRHGDAG
ncbi:MAG: hypothetical protein JO127_08955 [Caulobacteraceae bacterium]|nr:hypothetical protein [Caulobacteraceae bacterium]